MELFVKEAENRTTSELLAVMFHRQTFATVAADIVIARLTDTDALRALLLSIQDDSNYEAWSLQKNLIDLGVKSDPDDLGGVNENFVRVVQAIYDKVFSQTTSIARVAAFSSEYGYEIAASDLVAGALKYGRDHGWDHIGKLMAAATSGEDFGTAISILADEAQTGVIHAMSECVADDPRPLFQSAGLADAFQESIPKKFERLAAYYAISGFVSVLANGLDVAEARRSTDAYIARFCEANMNLASNVVVPPPHHV
jgi:hypothetical protein